MWICPNCNRTFTRTAQSHSCRIISLEQHFQNKAKAKQLFDFLLAQINTQIGQCRIISLPCCVHLFGSYDFLAAIPKKDHLEIRFALNQILDTPRLKQSIPISAQSYKHCFDLRTKAEINKDLINWLSEAYHLKD